MPYECPIAIPPGDTIINILSAKGITWKLFGARMGWDYLAMLKLIDGSLQITSNIANRLEQILGIKASFWLNIEQDYKETLIRLNKSRK